MIPRRLLKLDWDGLPSLLEGKNFINRPMLEKAEDGGYGTVNWSVLKWWTVDIPRHGYELLQNPEGDSYWSGYFGHNVAYP